MIMHTFPPKFTMTHSIISATSKDDILPWYLCILCLLFNPQPHYISQQPSIQLTTAQRFVKAVTASYFFEHVKRVRYSSVDAWCDNGRDATCPACASNSWLPCKHKHHKDIVTFEFYK